MLMKSININNDCDDVLDLNDNLLFSYFMSCMDNTELPKSFYHYTKIGAVRKIIQNNKISFKLSPSDKMENNGIYDEGKDIIERYEKVCQKLYNDKQISNNFYQLIKDIIPKNISWFGDCGHKYISLCRYYVGCFCLIEDCPKMLNNYGDYVLEFNQQFYNVGRVNANNCNQKDFRLVRVIYSNEEKDKMLMKEIEWCYEIFNKNQEHFSLIREKIKSYIFEFLQLNSLMFKNEKYEYEREIRIICCSEKSKTEKEDDGVYIEFDNPRDMLLSLTHIKMISAYDEVLKYIS